MYKRDISNDPDGKQERRQVNKRGDPYRRALFTPFSKRRLLPFSLLKNHLPWPGQPMAYKTDKSMAFSPDKSLLHKAYPPTMYSTIKAMQTYKPNLPAGLKVDQITMSRKGTPLYQDSYCDSSVKKQGSFKINDGPVQGTELIPLKCFLKPEY